jgi:hypothetical protein
MSKKYAGLPDSNDCNRSAPSMFLIAFFAVLSRIQQLARS